MKRLPKICDVLLKLFLENDHYLEKCGDLSEVFNIERRERNFISAYFFAFSQTFKTILAYHIDKLIWGMTMFRNYFKISIRNLLRQKAFSLINIFGLSVGLTCCILIGLFVQSELNVDTYHEKADRIYQTGQWFRAQGNENIWSSSTALTATVLADECPEVQKGARFKYASTSIVRRGDKIFSENNLIYSDTEIFDILTIKLIKGNSEGILDVPYTMVIDESLAEKYFGSEDPLGQTLKLNNERDYTITGVMENIPVNSLYEPDAFISMKSFILDEGPDSPIFNDWVSFNFNTLLLLKEGSDPAEVQEKINTNYHKYADERLSSIGLESNFLMKPFTEMYLEPFGSSNPPIVYIYIFSLVALAILIIACVNFMNLSTARSASRSREVGIRKVLGSERKKITVQFILESVLLAFLSLLVAIGLVWLTIPLLNNVVLFELKLSTVFNPYYMIMLLGFTLFAGILAGSYPAFYLSSFKPVSVLKGKPLGAAGRPGIRKILVIGQFVIAIVLIIGSVMVLKQLDYLKSKDPGFEKGNLVRLNLPGKSARPSLETIKTELLSSSHITNVSAASTIPSGGGPSNAKIPEGFTQEEFQSMIEINVDRDYVKTLGLQLIAGRDFSSDFGLSEPRSVIINENAVKRYGWENPVGKIIKSYDVNTDTWSVDMTVIGVVKDFHQNDLMRAISPIYIGNDLNSTFGYNKLDNLLVRIKQENKEEAVSFIENKWKALMPDIPFSYTFVDETFDRQFRRIERAQKVVGYFTLLTIVIACLGLFGLISYLTEQRTKEIGIRKTLGASFQILVGLLIKDFSKWILLANLIAWPVSYFIISKILENFAYRIDISFDLFFLSGLAAFLLGLLTIISRVIKAALTNPADSLKYE